jgi:putative flippase GtrA
MRSLIRFGISGLFATLTHAVIFVALIEFVQVRPLYATVPAFLSALAVSYLMNYRWTFSVSGPHKILLPKYFLVSIVGLLLNLMITWLLVDIWGAWYGFALLAIIITVPISTFLLSKFWVFRQ